MNNWLPKMTFSGGARYLAIADALARDIRNGILQPGDKLPTHRDLAWHLGVTVGTVSRGYAEAERRGLTYGEVGRGTFVLGPLPAYSHSITPEDQHNDNLIALDFAYPPEGAEALELEQTLKHIAGQADMGALLSYQPHTGMQHHREAGAKWLKACGLDVSATDIVLTSGGHHAISVVLAAMARPGDRILCDELTFPGIQSIARLQGLKTEGIALDSEGMIPAALDEACKNGDAKFLYLVPNCQNPTTRTLSLHRREALVEVARKHRLSIIEDDAFTRMADGSALPTLYTLAPERTYYFSSLSKSIAPGLRIGYLCGPKGSAGTLAMGVRTTSWMTAPIAAEVATHWIESGTVDRILKDRIRETKERMDEAVALLEGYTFEYNPVGLYIWLHLPDQWRSQAFVSAARQNGVLISGSEPFVVGRRVAPHCVRVCIGKASSRETMRLALQRLRKTLEQEPEPTHPVF
ncbi:aminotransferase-like domain-containing protein [Kiloniella sp. b19]|uniref:aminotransferase-like domain-containing protein n=1 Tax=Kiloniella sp. GXU_MW_B19 TaxID=3141326 RepID=UPI0031D16C53